MNKSFRESAIDILRSWGKEAGIIRSNRIKPKLYLFGEQTIEKSPNADKVFKKEQP